MSFQARRKIVEILKVEIEKTMNSPSSQADILDLLFKINDNMDPAIEDFSPGFSAKCFSGTPQGPLPTLLYSSIGPQFSNGNTTINDLVIESPTHISDFIGRNSNKKRGHGASMGKSIKKVIVDNGQLLEVSKPGSSFA